MWKKLGFRESPYDTKPLKVSNSDVELLMGRQSEQVDFLTALESDKQGIFILSGVPGVGKTSFLNIQQYLSESGAAGYGPKLLAARTLCPIQPSDEPKHIALRCMQCFCKSIEEYCIINQIEVPKLTSKVLSWIYEEKPATISFGFTIVGTGATLGRDVHLPSVKTATYETLVDILGNLSEEVKHELGFEGSFIVLDNIENLYEDDLSDCLTTFRDTLFMIPNIWWIVVGQSGLTSLIQSTNPKVYQRLSASIELRPISVGNLIKAVDIRVATFHDTETKGSSPIKKDVYVKLFESSNGEIRFVFKYCHNICINLVQTVRKQLTKPEDRFNDSVFDEIMGKYLVKNQVHNKFANQCLENIISDEFSGLYLTQNEKSVLKKIGQLGTITPNDFKDFKEFGVGTMQNFTINFLVKLRDQQLLFRRQEGKKITYELRGISVFALEYFLLEN